MKIAYLISAHTDAPQLKRLYSALCIDGVTDFFIHIDKKSDIKEFEDLLPSICKHVTYCKTRIYTQWGGYSQCLYQKALITECIKSGITYDRVFFISGLDYPLWSNKRILKELEDNPRKEYMKAMDITKCDNPPKIKDKITLYHFFRDVPIPYKYKKILSGGSRIIMRMLPFRKKRFIVDNGIVKHIYQASSWWCLTGACVKYIYDEFKNNNLVKYFKYSFAPDEMMIPTIVFNSPFAKNAQLHVGVYPGLVGLTYLHYIEYNKEIKTFQEDDFEMLMESNKMFARKFQTGVSDKLMDRLDKEHNLIK